MEKTMASKAFMKAIGFAGCLLLTVFAGMFAMTALGLMVVSVVEGDLFTAVASAVCGVIAWMMWNIRKDTLV